MKYQKHRPREVIISSLGRNEIPKYCPRDVMINGLGRNEIPEICTREVMIDSSRQYFSLPHRF